MTNPEQSVIDSIDALIDEQLDAGEPIGGYDYDDPDYPKCWRCNSDWHGLPAGMCPGSAVEGPAVPQCPHCKLDWHLEPVTTTYGTCNGSTFIGPRRPTVFEEPRDADGYLPNVARALQLPQLRFFSDEFVISADDLNGFGQSRVRAPQPRNPWLELLYGNLLEFDQLRHSIRLLGGTYDESWNLEQARTERNRLLYAAAGLDNTWTARRWLSGDPQPHRRGGHSIAYSITDEIDHQFSQQFRFSPIESRPWLWVPRQRVIPAYTVEPGPTMKLWDGEFRCTGEIRNLRITGTVPELVDATMPTLGTIPRWATDAEQLRWALTHPTIPDGRPYTYGRDFHIGVGARVGWDNGDGNVWIGTVTEEPKHSAHGWSITLGGQTPAHTEPPVGDAVQTLADYWRRRDSHQQPPMWTVNPARSRRVNTRRRHR